MHLRWEEAVLRSLVGREGGWDVSLSPWPQLFPSPRSWRQMSTSLPSTSGSR